MKEVCRKFKTVDAKKILFDRKIYLSVKHSLVKKKPIASTYLKTWVCLSILCCRAKYPLSPFVAPTCTHQCWSRSPVKTAITLAVNVKITKRVPLCFNNTKKNTSVTFPSVKSPFVRRAPFLKTATPEAGSDTGHHVCACCPTRISHLSCVAIFF